MNDNFLNTKDSDIKELVLDASNPAIPLATKIFNRYRNHFSNLYSLMTDFKKKYSEAWKEVSKSNGSKISIIDVLSRTKNAVGIVYLMEHHRPNVISDTIERLIPYFNDYNKEISNILTKILHSNFSQDIGTLAVKFRYKADMKRLKEQEKRAALRKELGK